MRNFSDTKKLDMKLVKLNEQDYNEIQRYVEDILSKRPTLDKVIQQNLASSKLRDSYKDFKLPNFTPFKLGNKEEGKLSEKEFLKRFVSQAKSFSENVTTELEVFATDIRRRAQLVKDLQKEQKERHEELEILLDTIKEKKDEYQKRFSVLDKTNSAIRTKIESITSKLLNKISAPLSKREEEVLIKIQNLTDQATQLAKSIEVQKEVFKEERIKEEKIMKDYKVKFSQETIDTQIKPKVKKLLTLKQDIQNYRSMVAEALENEKKY